MISIIMSTYNGEAYLKEQIESIIHQDYEDWKLFIFDDGSKDKTEEIAKEYMKKEGERISFFRNPKNFGAKGNFFNGLYEVSTKFAPESEYYAFSDQDDVWDRDKLSLTLSEIKKIEGKKEIPSCVFTDVRMTDGKLREIASSYFEASKVSSKKLDFASLLMENKAIGGTMLLNRSIVKLEEEAEKRMGGLPKNAKLHDWWFALLGASKGRVAFVDRATESYRQHERNVVGGKSFFAYVKDRLTNYSKIRESIRENVLQGDEFYHYFAEGLEEREKEVLEGFIRLSEAGFFERRRLILKYGFMKSGFVRNLALFLFV